MSAEMRDRFCTTKRTKFTQAEPRAAALRALSAEMRGRFCTTKRTKFTQAEPYAAALRA